MRCIVVVWHALICFVCCVVLCAVLCFVKPQSLRRAIDPFYAYRHSQSAQRLTLDDVKRLRSIKDQVECGPASRELSYGEVAFCPVHRIDQQLLVSGKAELGVRVGRVSYSCCSDGCVSVFLNQPLRYHVHDLTYKPAPGYVTLLSASLPLCSHLSSLLPLILTSSPLL